MTMLRREVMSLAPKDSSELEELKERLETMTSLTVGTRGEIALPADLRQRYGFSPDTQVRIVETRHGILLVPLSDAPMSPELEQELAEWQALSVQTWTMFPYEDDEG